MLNVLIRYFNVLPNTQFNGFFWKSDIFEIIEIFRLKMSNLAQIFWFKNHKKSYPKSIKIERFDSTDSSTGTTKSKNDKNNPYEKPPYSYMAMIQVNIWPI